MTKQYRLLWIDAYLLDDNWENVDEIKKHYPITSYSKDGDGWVDCEHCYEFNAINIEEAKNTVSIYINEIGRCIDFFSVVDENNNVILTEGDY